jgi:UTP--glucose-1-phosphate uridylyltransferase
MSEEGLREASEKMRADGVADAAIDVFAHYYEELEAGASGMLPEADIEPVADLPRAEHLPDPPDGGKDALGRTVMIKLNGGLGTSMGMTRAKSLLEVKDGLTFLDIIVRQTQQLGVPLALMNSFVTSEETMGFLRERYPDADVREFLQNKEPKLLVDDLAPAEWPADPELEWAPPGHGDIYVALQASGMLRSLLDDG